MITPDKLARVLAEAPHLVHDTETDGLDWRFNKSVGYVLTWGAAPDETTYMPFAHATGNMDWDPRPIYREVLRKRGSGHHIYFNAAFDLKFFANDGVEFPGFLEDAQINAFLVDDRQTQFSLDACCRFMKTPDKKGDALYAHMASIFGGKPERSQMARFWELAGNDPLAVDYAAGDGTATWGLWAKQQQVLDDDDLRRIWDIECRCIRTLHRMSYRGIRVDEARLHQLRGIVDRLLTDAMSKLPPDFNIKAPSQLKKLFTDAGITDWPTTEKGNASFSEEWLETTELGRTVVAARKFRHLENSFLTPMVKEHLYKGRVHTNFNQVRGEEFGTNTGRLSSNHPNLQQCVRRGTRITVPGGYKNVEDIMPGDWVYCFDDGLRLRLQRVSWSGRTGTRPVVRVHWEGSGGRDSQGCRPRGHVDLTDDHPVRLTDGAYVPAGELRAGQSIMALHRSTKVRSALELRNHLSPTGCLKRYKKHTLREARFVFEEINGWVPEAVHHDDHDSLNDSPSNLVGMTISEHSKLHIAGVSPEEKSRRYKSIRNSKEIQRKGGQARRAQIYRSEITRQRVEEAITLTGSRGAAAVLLGCGLTTIGRRLSGTTDHNHRVVRIEVLEGEHDVYDITVPIYHNFIAGEICVHNCHKRDKFLGSLFRSIFVPDPGMVWGAPDYSQVEPRILAHVGQVKVLLEGYLSEPHVDAHTAVANAAGIDRQSGKTLNQALITGAGERKAASMLGRPIQEANAIVSAYFAKMPEIKPLQKKVENVWIQRGFIRSLLGRRCRLDDVRFAYKGLNRVLQVGNADVIKKAMCEVDEYLISEGDATHLLNSVHDALDFQYRPDLEHQYRRSLEIMQDFGPSGQSVFVSVPLIVEEDSGANWAEATYGKEVVEEQFRKAGARY